ncbi:MAG: DUF2149 domain-containing protein [Planctomycetes bacterium]|nr:DUF2149 domain-containing protein [Planctomycetota bacterium]
MSFLSTRPSAAQRLLADSLGEDPLSMVANLFDVSVVLITGLFIALFSVYRLQDLVDSTSEVTVVVQREGGELTLLEKKGKRIQARRVTGKEVSGDGTRLGTAYRLKDGKVIYVPEDGSTPR